jgi:YfiH family protein
MFYFNGNNLLKSSILQGLEHCFTTRGVSVEDLGFVNLIHPTQTHSANVAFVKPGVADYPDTDALVLDGPGAVYLKFADCTPVILYNRTSGAAAVAHAGWRGTAQKIVQRTVEMLGKGEIAAAVGPAICGKCYDVGEEVFERLAPVQGEFERRDGKIFVDLKSINARQLREAGVNEVDICPYCTCCNNDLFYSYRKENGTANRHYAVIRLTI